MKSPLFNHPEYKKVVECILDAEKKIKKLKQEKIYDSTYIANLQQQAQQAMKTDLANFYKYRAEEIENKLKEIEESHKKDYYEEVDVQKELLRRQDITRKLKLSKDEDLKARVEEFKKTGEGDLIGLEMLELELMERGMDHERIHLNAYVDHYDIKTPFRKDEEYQELSSELGLIPVVKNRDWFYVPNEDGEAEMYAPKY